MEFFLKKDVFKRIAMRHIFFHLGLFAVFLLLLFSVLGSFEDMYYVILPLFLIYEMIKQTLDFIKLKKEWYTYRILLDEESIHKTQFKKDDIAIMREDIRRIIEIPKSGLSVQTHNTTNCLFIPKTLEDYEACRAELAKWYTIEESPITPPSLTNEAAQFKLASQSKSRVFDSIMKGVGIVLGGFILLVIVLFVFIFFLAK
jgi:hypothetical protein